MKHSTWFAATLFCLPAVALATGCGGDDESEPDGAVTIDADETPDAKPAPVDAMPAPDATPPDLSCVGAPDAGAVAVPAQIVISGVVRTQGIGGSTQLFDAGVAAFAAGNDSVPLAETFSQPVYPVDAGAGQPDAGPPVAGYSMQVPTNNQPLVGYVRFTPPAGSEPIVPNYVFSPDPIVGNVNVSVPMFPESLLGLVQSLAKVTQLPERGLALVTVTGCPDNMGRRPAVAEAVVTVSTADAMTKVVYLDTSDGFDFGTEQTFASGIAFVFNIPPGPFDVTAKYSNVDFRTNKVKAFAGPGATATQVVP